MLINKKMLVFFLCLVFILVGSANILAEEPRFGGHLRVGLQSESVPSLDLHQTGVTITYHVGWHILETLFTLDEEYKVIPMLAKDYEVSDDGLKYTIWLRENVKFHNQSTMDAHDVVASLERWAALAGVGRRTLENVNNLTIENDYTIVFELKEPMGIFLLNLAIPNQGAYIYPKELVEEFGEEDMGDTIIGTGPFKLDEWIRGRHIQVSRFDDYSPVDFDATGYGGKKVAYVDRITFLPFPDSTVRAAAVETGSVHQADFAPTIEYQRLEAHPNVNTWMAGPRGFDALMVNARSELLSDPLIRQAILAVAHAEEVARIRYDDEAVWSLSPSIFPEGSAWYSEAGAEYYNQANPERARELLEEAGYDGTPLKLMTSTGRQEHGITFKRQLEAAGFVVEDTIVEWATLVSRRGDPELWDLYTTGFTWRADPTQLAFLDPNFAGWWEHPRKEELVEKMEIEHAFEKRFEYWEEIQELIYEDVPLIKLADYKTFRISHVDLKNYINMIDIFFWNTWLD